jgi:cold shock CspA family protein
LHRSRVSMTEYVGTLVQWRPDRGFGFLKRNDGVKNFCHISQIRMAGVDFPSIGEVYSFELDAAPDGRPRAARMRLVSAAG